MGVNSFTLSAQAVNPKITTKLVMIDTWFDPAKERPRRRRWPISAAISSPPTPIVRPRCRSAKSARSMGSARAPTCRASRRMRT